MTLLVALKGSDGLVLAADSRGTFGDPRLVTAQNDSMQKAHVVARHVGVLVAGAGELAALIVREATAAVSQQSLDGVTPVVEALRTVARNRFQEWFPSLTPVAAPGPTAKRPDLAFLIGGYDLDDEGKYTRPNIYQLQGGLDFPPMLHQYGFAVAGVPQYALYLLNRLYQPDRGVEELTALAIFTITETASQDGKVGGPVRVITAKPEGGCALLDDQRIALIARQNVRRATALRNSFYGTGRR